MPRKTAEILKILGELCATKGPRLTLDQIITHLERCDCFDSEAKLAMYAKKIKAREYAKKLTFVDEETGRKFKRLWSFRDSKTGKRAYADILDMTPESRKALISKYVEFKEMLSETKRTANERFPATD